MLHHRFSFRTPFEGVGALVCFWAVILFASNVHAQSWQTLSRLPQIINTSFFFDTTTGFLGSGATYGAPNSYPEPVNIYRTTNGGQSWVPMAVPQNYMGSVSQIFMMDRMNGWASVLPWNSSNNQRLWKTTDGGQSWNEMPSAGMGTCVYQTSHALIVTELDAGKQGCVSTDGGITFDGSIPGGTNCIGFLNDTDGILTVFRGGPWQVTTDGGVNWTPMPIYEESWGIGPVKGTNTYYDAGENVPTLVTKSTDKGLTWTTLHSFPFETSGDIRVADSETLYVQVNTNLKPDKVTGVLRSTDGGVNWINLGGPQNFNDSRFSIIPTQCGAVIFAFDTGGGAFKLDDIFRHVATGIDFRAEYDVTASSCQPQDTTIITDILGCLPSTGHLDSAWLTGSLAFALGQGTFPRTLDIIDSIPISYAPSLGTADTSWLHLRYDIGSGARDTTILLTGTASALTTNPQLLHREAASAFYGQIDSLPMAVDLGSNINLDSLWPYLTDIQGTFAFDSSVVSFASYNPPSGWTVSSLANHGNSVDFGIHKISAQAGKPLALGTALFLPSTDQLATSWVTLPRFVMQVGGKDVSLCVTQNEDSHWSVKTLGAPSDVGTTNSAVKNISVYPNPAADRLFIRNPLEHSVPVTIYDAIGRVVLSIQVPAGSTSTVSLASLPSGTYLVSGHSGTCIIVSHE